VCTGGDDGVARVWDGATGALLAACERTPHGQPVTSVAWSPHHDALRDVTKNFTDPRVKWVAGDPQLKYFGRFQIALQAPSTHLAFFDDDCIPGDLAVANAFHVMYLKSRRYYGLIGMKGHWGSVEEPVTHIQQPYHITWEFRPPMAKQVDLTGGLWFLRREWLHIMFRDNPFTLETGEDFQLTYTLRKYMGASARARARARGLAPPSRSPALTPLPRPPHAPPPHLRLRRPLVAALLRLF
jgi:hypothetical protein